MSERLRTRHLHRFEAAGKAFLYLQSAAIFALDDASRAILDLLEAEPRSRHEMQTALAARWPTDELEESLDELVKVEAVAPVDQAPAPMPKIIPLEPFPLTTMVMNVTNQCNLACAYCYEYGEDKIVETANGAQPKFMSEETATQSVDFMLREAGPNKVVHMTLFGGETLLNLPVLKIAIPYARQRAMEAGKRVEFNLTTNATLLKPDVVDFLVENDVAVTISIDGPPEMQDTFRVFRSGAGSYDVAMPKIKELLRRHRTKPIGARVTLTSKTLDVGRIFRHLTDEVGFREVGFAPVTTSPDRQYAIEDGGFDTMLGQFRTLAEEFRDHALENRHHAFANVKDTLEEIHKGANKAYPCGAGLGLIGVATDGQVALCHRFAGSDEHTMGTVDGGIDRERQAEFLDRHHVARKTDCRTCWARPLCAGGCYHEAQTRYGATDAPNLHYCDWIREWTDVCLRIYGELAERNPAYLARFEGRVTDEASQAS
ncbi:MAG: quinohemoprotein amine dehydrogenase maturation protein [Vicinamibacterales bacterium]|nr:quinohemoprotein amine dehydrogenase maturation protein [Vicinamibacterales bacterium]MDP6608803.1 quinohemoprotein amine dehydrogenase maturation protein [Vicinamibacterales bacterium]